MAEASTGRAALQRRVRGSLAKQPGFSPAARLSSATADSGRKGGLDAGLKARSTRHAARRAMPLDPGRSL
jgi:hypothetical protein